MGTTPPTHACAVHFMNLVQRLSSKRVRQIEIRQQDGGSIGNLFQAPSVRGPPNSAELIQTRSRESCSSFTSQSSFSIGDSFHCIVDVQVSLLLCFVYAADANFN